MSSSVETIPGLALLPGSSGEHQCGAQAKVEPLSQAHSGKSIQDAISPGSDILCTDTPYLDAPCMDTMYLYLNCECVGDNPMISFLSDRTERCDVQTAETQGV